MPAGTVLLVILGALAVAALLNAGPMAARARASELGTSRDIRLGFWEPVAAFSSALGLDKPRAGFEALTDPGGPGSGADGVDVIAGPEPRRQLGHRPLDAVAAPAAGNDGSDSGGLDLAMTDDGSNGDDERGAAPAGPLAQPGRAADEAAGGEATATPLGLPAAASPADPGLDPADGAGVAAGGSTSGSEPLPGDGGRLEGREGPNGQAPAIDAATGSDGPIGGSPFALRRPTADDPLRVLIVGDSTMDAVGTAMLRELSTTGVTDARLDYRVSTGLSRPDFFDWPAHLREIRAAEQPEVIVIMIGANDAQPILVDGEVEQHGTDRWSTAYRQRVAGLLDELTAGESWVIWIGQPVMRNDPYDARLRGLNTIYGEETARYPTAVYVDPRPLTSGADGGYTAYLPDDEGNQELIRQADGVHFTPDGGDRVAPVVIEAINRVAPLY